ncbi:MAG: DNA-binding domain-containing protein [Methylovirgula sp.]|jgi:hypothetical protein
MKTGADLAAIQSAFQDAVLDGDTKVLGIIVPSKRLDSAGRVGVYQEAYPARLTEFLGNDYPVLRSAMGEEDFAALASAYIAATPSAHPNARWYGAKLPDFLRQEEPWKETRLQADLAAFERALADAFDAPDAEALQAGVLAAVAAEDQPPRLAFRFVPSLMLLRLAEGTLALYEAVSEETEIALPESPGEETVLIWRAPSLDPLYRPLADDEAMILDAAIQGATLDEMCELLSLRHDPDVAASHAAHFLARWFADGLIADLACR